MAVWLNFLVLLIQFIAENSTIQKSEVKFHYGLNLRGVRIS